MHHLFSICCSLFSCRNFCLCCPCLCVCWFCFCVIVFHGFLFSCVLVANLHFYVLSQGNVDRETCQNHLESNGVDVKRSRLEGRNGILTWKWTLEYLGHRWLHVQMMGCRQQRHRGKFPQHFHLHLRQKNTCLKCEVKECTRKHSGSELSGQKSAELLDARYARLPVRGSHTLLNARRIRDAWDERGRSSTCEAAASIQLQILEESNGSTGAANSRATSHITEFNVLGRSSDVAARCRPHRGIEATHKSGNWVFGSSQRQQASCRFWSACSPSPKHSPAICPAGSWKQSESSCDGSRVQERAGSTTRTLSPPA